MLQCVEAGDFSFVLDCSLANWVLLFFNIFCDFATDFGPKLLDVSQNVQEKSNTVCEVLLHKVLWTLFLPVPRFAHQLLTPCLI